MQTGRFINKLINDRLEHYQTEGVENLLNPNNLALVWNLSKEEVGEYENFFLDDMAITHTVITNNHDSSGRALHENDTIIIKFDILDTETILAALNSHLNLLNRMSQYQKNNSNQLKNPLLEVEI